MKKGICSIIAALTFSACGATAVYHAQDLDNLRNSARTDAHPRTMENLLSNIMESGFLRRTDRFDEEIQNNSYGQFDETTPGCDVRQGDQFPRGCYIPAENHALNDKVLVYSDAFASLQTISGRPSMWVMSSDGEVHLAKNTGSGFCLKTVWTRGNLDYAEASVVYGIFQDVWQNMLTEGQRMSFTSAAEELDSRLRSCVDDVDATEIELVRLGMRPRDRESVPELLNAKVSYGDDFARELFARVAQQAYANGMRIPENMRETYSGFINLDRAE